MKNQDVRLEAMLNGVRFWQIADKLGIRYESLSRRLRHELPEAEKLRIFEIIQELARGAE